MEPPKRVTSTCNFCCKSQDQVRHLIAGQSGASICDECIEMTHETLRKQQLSALLGDDVVMPSWQRAAERIVRRVLSLPS